MAFLLLEPDCCTLIWNLFKSWHCDWLIYLDKLSGYCVCPSDGDRGAAGADVEAVDGLLRYGGWGFGGHAEELEEAEPPACHSNGGEVAGRLSAACRLSNSF